MPDSGRGSGRSVLILVDSPRTVGRGRVCLMYPELFTIGGFTITSFGAMVAVGAGAGLWLLSVELRRRNLPAQAVDIAVWSLLAGLLGARLLYVFEHLGEAPLSDLVLSRGGMSWFGGLFGGMGTGLVLFRHNGLPILPILSAAAPALALGHFFGRIGCFLVGDDYGHPTDLPWGVAFPRGLPPTTVPVHPTQLYEAAVLLPLVFLLVHWRRRGVADAVVLGRYLAMTGAARFIIEFLRANERILLGLSVAHLASLGVVAAGVVLLTRRPFRT